MTITTINTLGNPGNNAYENLSEYCKAFFSDVQQNSVYEKFAKDVPLTAHGTAGTFYVDRYDNFTVSQTPTALDEGVTPDATPITTTRVTGTFSQYGQYSVLTDQALLLGHHGVIMPTATASALGGWAAETSDNLVRNALVSGSSVYYCGGVTARTSLDNSCTMSVRAILGAVLAITANRGKPYGNGMMNLFLSARQFHDLSLDPLWFKYRTIDAAKKNGMSTDGSKVLMPTSLYKGTLDGEVDIYVVDNYPYSSGGGSSSNYSGVEETSNVCDVHIGILLGCIKPGEQAYGMPSIGGGEGKSTTAKLYYTPPGGQGDPLHQRTCFGTKFYTGSVIMNSLFIVRIESTVSSN